MIYTFHFQQQRVLHNIKANLSSKPAIIINYYKIQQKHDSLH